MNIYIICIGKLKEKYWRDATSEYMKRLKKYCKPEIVELKEVKPDGKSPTDEELAVKKEGESILSKISPDMYVISLEIGGKRLSSEDLSNKISSLAVAGKSKLAFIIGGSLGLSDDVSQRADFKLSFSDLTFTHQMMRVILLEQVYRSFKIINKEPYHK
jgi:23S rRNA (pseudouridine1915-N3)-methyltransferase